MALVLENGIWKLEADAVPATPTTTTMAPTGDHTYQGSGVDGVLADGDKLTGGTAWDGWTVQIPADGSLTLVESTAGLTVTFQQNSSTGATANTNAPTSCVGLYKEVTGDFVLELPMTSENGSTYKNFSACAWMRGDISAHYGIGTGSPYTDAKFNRRVGVLPSAGGVAQVLGLAAWAAGYEFQLARTGNAITFFDRTVGSGTWVQRYPTGTATGYSIVANTARVGFLCSNWSASSDEVVVTNAALITYTAV
jgi:hypothetical protein